MDDAFILNTTLLSSFFPPFLANGRGQPRLASPPAYCRNPQCKSHLIEMEYGKHIALVCDRVGCYLFRERQEYRERVPLSESETAVGTENKSKPVWLRGAGYQVHNERKKANYRLLRDLGLSYSEVINNTSDKRTKEILERVQLGGVQLTLPGKLKGNNGGA